MARARFLKSRWHHENDLGQARKTSQAGFTEIFMERGLFTKIRKSDKIEMDL